MAAFFIVTTTVKDQEAYQTYVQRVGPTLIPFGGKAILRGKADSALVGELTHQTVGVIEFPDVGAIKAWYASDIYQALIPLRTRAAEMSITTYAIPE